MSDDEPISDEPRAGGLYQHFGGGFFVVLGRATATETGDECVVFLSIADGKHYTRKVVRWFAPSPDAPNTKRYKRIGPSDMRKAMQWMLG